jgi:hypothetical protein
MEDLLSFIQPSIQPTLYCSLFQQIPLPEIQFDKMEIQFTSKAQNAKARLLIDHISEDENIIVTDTLTINCADTLWNTSSHEISDVNMKFIGFRLFIFTPSELLDKRGIYRAFWIDRLNIFLDGKPIDTCSPPVPFFSVKDSQRIKVLSDGNFCEEIPELRTKKIVALGETVHGSRSINEITAQIIKHQILNNNCRLVMVEIPFEVMIFLNKEIQGETGFKGDRIFKSCKPLFDHAVWDDLIAWMGEYNKGHRENPITLMGTDISLLDIDHLSLLSQYVACLNTKINSPALTNFSNLLSKFHVSEEALAFLEKNPEIEKTLPPIDCALIIHSLKTSKKISPSTPSRFNNRDLAMKDNAVFSINQFVSGDESVFIETHFVHSNYCFDLPGMPVLAFGSYMKELYGEKYACLGISLGHGDILTTRVGGSVENAFYTQKISPPLQNSIEDFFDRQAGEMFYCNARDFNDGLSNIRYTGTFYVEDQFILVNPKARMDGLIFIKNSKAAKW